MNWSEVVQSIKPHIVRIETPTGHGTGFHCLHNHDGTWCGIATAAHVVAYAEEWQQPIRLRAADGKTVMLYTADRAITIDHATDSAVIVFQKNQFPLPANIFPLFPSDQPIPVGSEVGWLGFPSIEPYELCFFSGCVSAHKSARRAYLIDGVAINGVSGGPVIYHHVTKGAQIVGTVSAYYANRSSGEALPGLLLAQDVSHFNSTAQHIQSIDQARAQKESFEREASQPPVADQT